MSRLRALAILGSAGTAAACAGTVPSAPPSRAETAEEAFLEGDAEGAAREARLSIQQDPLDARSHFVLGCLLAQKGEREQAIVGFRRAWTIDPAHPAAAYNVGTLHLARDEAVDAARWLETALSSRPGHVPTCNNLGKAYFLAGLPELAGAAYEEALRIDPANEVALRSLALLCDAAGLADAAAGYRRRLLAAGFPAFPPPLPSAAAAAEPQDTARPGAPGAPVPPPERNPDGGAAPPADTAADERALRELLKDLRWVKVERRGDRVAVSGWTRDPNERAVLDRVLHEHPGALDLTTGDTGDSQRLIEVDATLFVVIAADSVSLGFNFLRLIDFTFDYFAADHRRDGTGLSAPGTIGLVGAGAQQGWLVSASVDYDVNIANAVDEQVAILARPHLTTLSGTSATFLAGGEFVFQVSGLNSGDIKPYPFGTTLKVTPTLLRTPGDDGRPRVHLDVEAGRTSVLEFLTLTNPDEPVVFDKVNVSSQAVLGVGETLILSGLSQTERRVSEEGVPVLSSIPILKYFFSSRTSVETQSSVIILLTPRDPAFAGEKTRKAVAEFVEMRRQFVRARQGTPEDFRRFEEEHPGWRGMAPNRFASHLFLMAHSDFYRAVSGQDLASESLDLDLLDDSR